MKMKTLLILPLALGAILAPLYAVPVGEGPFRGEIIQKLMAMRDDLGLTDTQKQEIRGVIETYRSEIKDQWAIGKSAREGMRTAVQEYGAESPEASATAEKIGDAATSGSLLLAKILSDVKPLLTEDQIQKMQDGRADISKLLESRLNVGGL